uniref:Neurogenic locus notch homolog protein 2 n=1 Tax=Chelonoidis abingdonii TaxID=106734 RepID=A0A8C0GY29_CHEAB
TFDKCPEGFLGDYCQYKNPCESHTCQNGGTCETTSVVGKATCKCALGFTGEDCRYSESHICFVSHPCLNGGTCQLLLQDTYECVCPPGYAGKDCQWIDACMSQPCANGSTCITSGSGFSCTCLAGYTGPKCEIDLNECATPGQCQNGGTCHNLPGSYQCQCKPGFRGHRCENTYVPCSPSPCMNGGTCHQTSDFTFECNCLPGFEGSTCEQNIDDCPNHNCQNDGVCVDGVNTYNCHCLPQWTGQFCTEDVDECQLQPNACQNGGTCTNHNGGHSCVCVNGWSGEDCSKNIDDCFNTACAVGSTCIDRVASFTCICPEGKTGLLCHLDDACVSNPCLMGALCDTNPLNGHYICTCPQGYKGADCTDDVDECAMANSNPCEHAGKCVNTEGSFHCECLKGYTGPRCEMDINECVSEPCQNDATCLDKIGGFTCLCMPGKGTLSKLGCVSGFSLSFCLSGFTGAVCQIDIDDCSSTPCLNGAKCVDYPNGYECQCATGFTGTLCEENINNCDPDPCHHGECQDGIDSYTCVCNSGYMGAICSEQVDECQSNPCLNEGRCIDLVNGYQCNCLLGTSGVNCENNLDDCASNPCIYGVCLDGINRYDCVCKPGVTGPRCNIDIDECISSPCHNGGTCVNEMNGFRCLCPEGFHQPSCHSQADECLSSPCIHGNCTNDVSGYMCLCDPGWVGTDCEVEENACLSNPCQNGGICDSLVDGYRCSCRKGFKGENMQNVYQALNNLPLWFPLVGVNCQLVLSACSPDPCENSGICQESPDLEGYICQCAAGWEGQRCTVDIDECMSKPCKNHAVCHNTQGSYLCECRPGFTGGDCESNIDDCLSSPCQNGASCVDGVNSFLCTCLPGFQGDKCQTDINECLSEPCKNGGTCTDYVNSYTCKCQAGFEGTHCENNIDECTESSCFNGATCVDGINSFSCQCPVGFTGAFCLMEINECNSYPCLNKGTCVDRLGTYQCICPLGYTGKDCQTLMDLCSKSPCKNKGTCVQRRTQSQCICPPGWTGTYCDVPNVSCQVAASQRGVPVDQLCQHSGICLDVGNSHRCQCGMGYTGSYCEEQLDECTSNPCQNGATCSDYLRGYQCECVPGYQGVNCEYEVDECQFQPCQNGGTCIDLVNHFMCSCPPGTRGRLCEENIDDCASDLGGPHCFNGGQCIDQIGGYTCHCLPGFAGERCEGDINECLSNPCSPHGSLDCIQLVNDYTCICRSAFTGRHCETLTDVCPQQPCQNGGSCVVASHMPVGFICQCPPFGSHSVCGQVKCKKGEQCIQTSSGPQCYCPKLSAGTACQTGTGCASAPCQNGGSCHPRTQPPYYYCQCPDQSEGSQCEHSVRPSQQPLGCPGQHCAERAKNGYCDRDCNMHACQWDGGDCSLTGEDPWANCSSSLHCWQHFNGECDELCNTPECLFDNFECQQNSKLCKYDKYCADHYADGRCDQGCNSEECGWDGLDCAGDKAEKLAEGTLIIVVLMPPEELLSDARSFLRTLGSLLHTNLRIKLDSQGNPMVFPYYGETPASRSRRSLSGNRKPRELEQEVIGTKVFLEIDNRQCSEDSDQCFKSTEAAAALLAAQAMQDMLPYPFVSVQSEPWLPKKTQLLYLLAVAAVIILFILLLGVLVAKRKRKHGSLWLPEGFVLRRDPSNHKRREPVGEDAVGLKNLSVQATEGNLTDCSLSEHWTSSGGPLPKRAKAEDQALLSDGGEQVDQRQWTQQHLEAADICGTPSLALTPPQEDQEVDGLDVNVRGPDGCTPLMLASLRVGSSEISDEDEEMEDSSANVITDLIYQGANLQAQTDRTGEMALHLAARYSRADAAKRLLDAGADANARDNMGRSPLHAAVAADAQGVFQILIRNRVTDLDVRMNDGTTPLILAARLAVEGMVAELINCQADVNAVDDHGKSALHWAAAVNNVEATLVLLKNGANRDMQDNKEETPLFLAAREGSFEAAKILLDHFANRDITDHMDRLPRDVAQDRMHHDIVHLLNEYNLTHSPPGHPGTMLSSALSPVICGPNRSFLNLKHASLSKKPRKPSAKGLVPTNLSKDAKRKGKKSVSESKGQFSESSVTLSPVDSLESPHAFVSEPISSPVMPSPGVLPSSPHTQHTATSVQAAHTMSFSNLHELQPLGCGSSTVLPSVSQLLSQHRITPPNCGLDRLRPVNISAEWMSRMEMNESQYNEMFGMVPQVVHSHPSMPQQSGMIQTDVKHGGVSRVSLPPIMTFQLVPKGGINQQAMPQQAQANCAQNIAGPLSSMYQVPDLAQLPSASFPMVVIPQQDGQVAQTNLPAYHQFQSSVGKYPTPPSQHSYSSSATERTPSHTRHLPGEHPYLTPSPESPDQWSSSSPHSASDWSDVATSPSLGSNQRGPAAHMSEQQRSNMQVYA